MSQFENPNSALRLGISSGALYPEIATEDAPIRAARLGMTDIEIMLQTAGEYGRPVMKHVCANARSAGCRITSVHVWTDLHQLLSPYRRRAEESRALFDRAIAAAVELDAGVLVWHGPRSAEVAHSGGWDRFVASVVDLGAACGEAGITLTLENVSRSAIRGAREVAALMKHLEEAAFSVPVAFTFDPFQAAEAGANPFMVLAAMGDRVANVHLSDYREREPNTRHLPPGEGDLPWPALMRAIVGVYQGPLILECTLGSDQPAAIERIRSVFEPLLASPEHRGDPCAGTPPPGVLSGIALFNERQFYECHEDIEHEWHAERGEIRRLYQGILQIGVGFHHALGGNHRGALLLLRDGIDKTSRFMPSCLGIDTARLVRESQACLDALLDLCPERLVDFDPATIPTIHFIGDEHVTLPANTVS
jgi:sugar phosphate isomerase/epimerase